MSRHCRGGHPIEPVRQAAAWVALLAATVALAVPARAGAGEGPLAILDRQPTWIDGGTAIGFTHSITPNAPCASRDSCATVTPHVVRPDGTALASLTPWRSSLASVDGGDVAWQPGGSGYALAEFAYGSGVVERVYVGDWRSGERTIVPRRRLAGLNGESPYGLALLWSSDGSHLAFGSARHGASYRDANGTIVPLGVNGYPLAWSGDGTHLALYSPPELRIVDVTSSTVEGQLTVSRLLAVSPDLRYAVAQSVTLERSLVDVATGAATSLEPGGPLGWSADARRYAFLALDGSLVVAGPGAARSVLADATPGLRLRSTFRLGAPAWSPAGDRIAWVDPAGHLRVGSADGPGVLVDVGLVPRDDRWLAWRDDVAYGESLGLPGLDAGSAPTIAWSPDGSSIAFDAGFGCSSGIKLARPDGSDLRWLSNDCRIVGTDGDDVIRGTIRRDVILAGAGNDVVHGGRSGDVVIAGPGNDRIDGGTEGDTVLAGPGDDLLTGGRGVNVLEGGAGNDRFPTGYASDLIVGGPGDDVIVDHGRPDVIDAGTGDDRVDARDGARDAIDGGPGLDEARTDRQDAVRRVERRLAEALA